MQYLCPARELFLGNATSLPLGLFDTMLPLLTLLTTAAQPEPETRSLATPALPEPEAWSLDGAPLYPPAFSGLGAAGLTV